MKKLILVLMLLVGVHISRAEPAPCVPAFAGQITAAESEGGHDAVIVNPGDEADAVSFKDFMSENWEAILSVFLAAMAIVVRLTPSEKDNDIFNFIKKILDTLVPNLKKEGGVHK